MKYLYKNLKKHCDIQGIPPGETMIFDHELQGGAIELVEIIDDEKKGKKKNTKEMI